MTPEEYYKEKGYMPELSNDIRINRKRGTIDMFNFATAYATDRVFHLQAEIDQLKKENEELIEALNSLLNPDLEKYCQDTGCPMCDDGVLRKNCNEHWDNCNWNIARAILNKYKK